MSASDILQLVGSVIGAALILLGTRMTVNASKKQAQVTREDNRQKNILDGFDKYTAKLEKSIEGLHERISRSEERNEELREERDIERELRILAVEYIRFLLDFVTQQCDVNKKDIPRAHAKIEKLL